MPNFYVCKIFLRLLDAVDQSIKKMYRTDFYMIPCDILLVLALVRTVQSSVPRHASRYSPHPGVQSGRLKGIKKSVCNRQYSEQFS